MQLFVNNFPSLFSLLVLAVNNFAGNGGLGILFVVFPNVVLFVFRPFNFRQFNSNGVVNIGVNMIGTNGICNFSRKAIAGDTLGGKYTF